MKSKVGRRLGKGFLVLTAITAFVGAGASASFGEDQEIALAPSAADQTSGSSFTLTLNYNVSDGNNQLTGLGLNIHFDSSKIAYDNYANFLNVGDLKSPPNLLSDTTDADGDPNTDKKINLSWTSLSFPSSWPNVALPAVLGELNFTVKEDAGRGLTPVNISIDEHDARYGTAITNAELRIQ